MKKYLILIVGAIVLVSLVGGVFNSFGEDKETIIYFGEPQDVSHTVTSDEYAAMHNMTLLNYSVPQDVVVPTKVIPKEEN